MLRLLLRRRWWWWLLLLLLLLLLCRRLRSRSSPQLRRCDTRRTHRLWARPLRAAPRWCCLHRWWLSRRPRSC